MTAHVGIKQHEGNKYVRKIRSCVDGAEIEVDVYAVLTAFDVTNPATAHAAKKVLCAGIRGKGSVVDDLNGAVAALHRAVEIEGGGKVVALDSRCLDEAKQNFSDARRRFADAGVLYNRIAELETRLVAARAKAHRLDVELQSKKANFSQTPHQVRVESMMKAFGQHVPSAPTACAGEPTPEGNKKLRELRARLIMEEALETIEDGLRVDVRLVKIHTDPGSERPVGVSYDVDFGSLKFKAEDGPVDLVELADGCADLSVVTTGTLSAFGIKDKLLLEEVDDNNLLKVERGHTDLATGKFIKPLGHPPPDIARVLARQGLIGPEGVVS